MNARHTLQPRQRIGQSRFRDYKSLPHIYCRRLVTETETKYTHLTVGPFSVRRGFCVTAVGTRQLSHLSGSYQIKVSGLNSDPGQPQQ
jgi:hypothetical protein